MSDGKSLAELASRVITDKLDVVDPKSRNPLLELFDFTSQERKLLRRINAESTGEFFDKADAILRINKYFSDLGSQGPER